MKMKQSLMKALDEALFDIEQDIADLEEDVSCGLRRDLIEERLLKIREKIKDLQKD